LTPCYNGIKSIESKSGEAMKTYWKSTLLDAEKLAMQAKKAVVRVLGHSAGGRSIYLFFYGKKNELRRTANYSSALGARNAAHYANKLQPDYRPTVFLAGGIHGAEVEGSMAVLNFIKIMETGTDFADVAHPALQAAAEAVNLVLVPFCNPDGRARVPVDGMVGKSLKELRYYDQGTWKETGALCGWPDCKTVHPMKGAAEFLGGYFNDDGINLMHDNPFLPMAEETKILYRLVEEYVPDFTVLLHGGDNSDANYFLKPAYAPLCVKKCIRTFEEMFENCCKRAGLKFKMMDMDCGENETVPAAFNLASALTHLCGEPCVTYETNQGLIDAKQTAFSEDEIYQQHLLLFQSLCAFVSKADLL